MSDEGPFDGRCMCGAVRYRMDAAPMIVHACHCTECRRLTGSAFALNAVIEAERVELLAGETGAVPVTGTSGKLQTIHRCPDCKVALWSHYPGGGSRISFIRVGTLAAPDRLPPDIHIYTSSKLPWLELPANARAVPEFYALADVWPEASLARWSRIQKSP
ncbi:MAG: GFA family protein [Allosphingosinicella sp.]